MMKTPTTRGRALVTTLPRDASAVTEFFAGDGTVMLGNMPQISFARDAAWTFEMWVYLDALVDEMNLISRAGEFVMAARGASIYAARQTQVTALVSAPFLETHTWYHLALTCDGSSMALYVDGRRVSEVTLGDAGTAPQGKPMTIGASFYGQTDRARFWSKALPRDEIYKNQWLDCKPGTAGLVAQIDFAQWPPVDTSGAQTPVTVSESGVRSIVFTPAADLESNAFCDPYNDFDVNPGGTQHDFTVMSWFAPTEVAERHVVFSNGQLGGAGMSVSLNAARQLQFQVGSSAPITSSSVVPLHQWTNVTCSWNAATGAAAIYVNGEPDVAGTMAFALPLAEGAPLIGAAADPGAPLPVANFSGYIQSVSVWSYVLSLEQIRRFHTADPLDDGKCIADYDLVLPRAQNSSSLNPVGLAGVGALTVLTSPRGASDPAVRSYGNAPPVPPVAPSRIAEDDFAADARARMVSEFRTFMREELGLSPAELEEYAVRMRDNLARVEQELRGGTHRVPYEMIVERNADGTGRLLLLVDGQRMVVYEGELDPCTVWAISFIISVVLTIYSVYGFFVNLRPVAEGLTNYLSQRISTVGLVAELREAFNNGVSPVAVYNALKVLHAYGLLTPMGKFLWQGVTQSISYWTIFSLGIRLVLLFSPYAPLEIAVFVTELALSLVGVHNAWNDPNNCWRSDPEIQRLEGAPA